MADELTKEEKTHNWSAVNRHGHDRFGCPCCRGGGDIRSHRKWSRKRAKERLRRRLRKIQKENQDQ